MAVNERDNVSLNTCVDFELHYVLLNKPNIYMKEKEINFF
jgi:hypothetical protein